jgi:hypothetical protein
MWIHQNVVMFTIAGSRRVWSFKNLSEFLDMEYSKFDIENITLDGDITIHTIDSSDNISRFFTKDYSEWQL